KGLTMASDNSSAADRDAVVAILQSQAECWQRGDAEGYAATAEDDLAFTNIRGQRWIGRAAFVKVHESILHGGYAGSRLECELEQLTCPAPGVIVAELLLSLKGASTMPAGVVAGGDGVLRTRLLEIFELRNGTWTLITYHNTLVIVN
ncbi:MAG TPA: SgcJ/EcaC family oxidoreductase, partial [Gemmatimonadaceae bacterium]